MVANQIVEYLKKPASEFTKKDIIDFIISNNIEILNFRYIGGDGRLKALSFVVSSEDQLDSILTIGERVDGSSLFRYIGADSSDLYVLPRYNTAFVNPFNETPTLEILCYYYTNEGKPLPNAPENILRKAAKTLTERTGYKMQLMGELEYYISSEHDPLFPATDQKGYHETGPFTKWSFFREEAMIAITKAGGQIKYGHCEVGNFVHGGIEYEQNEIEFLPTDPESAADQLVIAKWILRNLAYKYGVEISFAPKIVVGKAGSGLHVHTKLVDKNNNNLMLENGNLSNIAKKAIAGYLKLAPGLTAFGNTVPTSYLRLVPHQEAPTKICWGDRNRSVLVRVPLGWRGDVINMIKDANENEIHTKDPVVSGRQTAEFRVPDGSANIHLLLAGLITAALHGLESDDSLKYAEETYVNVNIFNKENKEKYDSLGNLPISCYESAEELLKLRSAFEKYDIFSPGLIDSVAEELKSYNDKGLSERLYGNNDSIEELVKKYLHFR